MITLNAIAKRLEEFGTNHFFIKSYSFGSPDDVDLDKFQEFPLMHVVYTGSDYDERTKTFSFEVYVFDRPNREEQMTINQREVVSDAQMCLEDVIADIANGGNIFLFDEDYEVITAGITPLIDERSNLLTGALLDLTIQVPYQRDACNLPINGVSPEGGEFAYQRRGILRVRTQDGTTDVQSVNEIRVTNGTLTDEGNGIVSIDTGGVDILGDLENVNLDDLQDHEALVYDQDTATWINGASTKIGIRIINQTGGTLYAGTPLRSTGVQGDQVTVAIYNARNHAAEYFIGLLSTDLDNGETGYARQTGAIYNLNTLAFNVGDILYPTGESIITIDNGLDYMTRTKPGSSSAVPEAKIPAAIVLRKHANTGRVYVRTWSPSKKLGDLDNVIDLSPTTNDVLKWNGFQWQAGAQVIPSLNDLRDVEIDDPEDIPNKSLLRWDASAELWRVIPETGGNLPGVPDTITYFIGRYNDEASTARQAADATLTIERYLTVQADGHGEEVSAQTDTPTSGNKIVRKIWHKGVSFEDSDVSTWTLVHTFADDTAYADTTATFNALLTAATYGSIPFSLAQTWEEAAAFTGLLDTYSGAAAAYSLRLLDSTYTGDAIRVRRASDNTEQDIGFVDNELDTSALATFCAGTDGFVKVWYDQSGNANDATQTTTGSQPKIYDASTGVELENGVAALRFDGTNDGLNCSTNLRASGGASTVITVSNIAVDAGAQNLFSFYKIQRCLLTTTTSNYSLISISTNDAADEYVRFLAANVSSQVLNFATWDGSSQFSGVDDTQLAQDGTLQTQTLGAAAFGVTASGTNSIGYRHDISAQYCAGTIQEVIIYTADKSANRAAIESNINDFYTIY